jgi:hypothetical protein
MAMELRGASGEGFATIAADGRVLDSWFLGLRTAGARLLLEDGRFLKAKELSGQNGPLFRRNSQSGALEATRRTPNWDGLNAQLHS